MNREEILQTLRRLKPSLASRYKVKALALFGSAARDDRTPVSDVDVLVDFGEDASLFDLSGLGLLLEEELGCRVDVVPRRAVREEIRERVFREAVPV